MLPKLMTNMATRLQPKGVDEPEAFQLNKKNLLNISFLLNCLLRSFNSYRFLQLPVFYLQLRFYKRRKRSLTLIRAPALKCTHFQTGDRNRIRVSSQINLLKFSTRFPPRYHQPVEPEPPEQHQLIRVSSNKTRRQWFW